MKKETSGRSTNPVLMGTSWRDSSLEFGRVNTAWLGEMLLVYSPIAIIVLTVLALISFTLGDGLATDEHFKLAWAVASAASVEGVMLALIIRASHPEKTWKYGLTLATLVPMVCVSILLVALVIYEQVTGTHSEATALVMLGVNPLALVWLRACLTIFAALTGLVFAHWKPAPTTKERAATTGVSLRTAQRQVARGKLKAVK